MGAILPRAVALGQIIPPRTGLTTMHLRNSNLLNEPMLQDTAYRLDLSLRPLALVFNEYASISADESVSMSVIRSGQ